MNQAKVFISYRHDDAKGMAQAVRDRLVESLPAEQVFMDATGLTPGAHFTLELCRRVAACDVLVALIGARWAGETGASRSRLHDDDDWVRFEIATALKSGRRVIPVLVDGAAMPRRDSLPVELTALADLQAFHMRSARLDADTWDLAGAIVTATGGPWPPPEPGTQFYAALAGLYALLAATIVLLGLLAMALSDERPRMLMLALALIAAASAVVLRLPLHPGLAQLTRAEALEFGAGLHFVGTAVFLYGDGKGDAVLLFLFGGLPAAVLYFSTYAMRRVVRQ